VPPREFNLKAYAAAITWHIDPASPGFEPRLADHRSQAARTATLPIAPPRQAYTLGHKCAINCCKRTILVQLIVKTVFTCFWDSVYCLLMLIQWHLVHDCQPNSELLKLHFKKPVFLFNCSDSYHFHVSRPIPARQNVQYTSEWCQLSRR